MSAPSSSPTESATTAQVIVERPPEGLAQGQYAWPAWAIGACGGLGVAAGLCYLLLRWRQRRSAARL